MHIRKQSEEYLQKKIDLSIEYAIHIHNRSLLIGVKSEWHIQKAKPYFSKKVLALEHVQHFANVLSRWASEARSVPSKVQQKMHICK